MPDIVPAILPKSFDDLEEKLGLVAGHAPVVQIDVCDGAFVPSRTWPYLKGAHDDIFDGIISQDSAMPYWEDVDFEFDLMTKGAYDKIPDYIAAGATRVIVHRASMGQEELEAVLRDYGKRSEELGAFDIELGLAIGNDARVEDVAPYIDRIHFVQVMGIDRIGFQGQSFNPRTAELVAALRKAYPDLIISIDGGVDLESGRMLADAGASRLVVGSAIFGQTDVLGALESFKNL